MGKKFEIALTVLLVCGGVYAHNSSKAKLNGVDGIYINKNILGNYLTAEIGEDAIKVAVSDSFTEEQKQYIKSAIEEFDFDVKGVEYEVVLNETFASPVSDTNCIHIKKASDAKQAKDDSTLGIITIKNELFTGRILYPLTIHLYCDNLVDAAGSIGAIKYFDYYTSEKQRYDREELNNWMEKEEEVVFKSTVKHELCHTLGLVDIRDKSMSEKTIMYEYHLRNRPEDLTEHDKNIINTIYKAKVNDKEMIINSTVELPKEVKIPKSYLKQVENEKVPFSAEEMEM